MWQKQELFYKAVYVVQAQDGEAMTTSRLLDGCTSLLLDGWWIDAAITPSLSQKSHRYLDLGPPKSLCGRRTHPYNLCEADSSLHCRRCERVQHRYEAK